MLFQATMPLSGSILWFTLAERALLGVLYRVMCFDNSHNAQIARKHVLEIVLLAVFERI